MVLRNQADLLAARPLIESAAAGVVGSDAFRGLFRRAVRDVHRAVFERDQDTVTLTLADVGTVVAAALAQVRPSLADADRAAPGRSWSLEPRHRLRSAADGVRASPDGVQLARLVLARRCAGRGGRRRARGLARPPPDRVALGIGAASPAWRSSSRCASRAAIALGHVHDPDARAAAGAVWDAFLGDLRTLGWLLAGCGRGGRRRRRVADPAASTSRSRCAAAWRIATTEPAAARAAGGARPRRWSPSGVLVIVAAADARSSSPPRSPGVYLVYAGVEALLRLIYRPPGRASEAARPCAPGAAASSSPCLAARCCRRRGRRLRRRRRRDDAAGGRDAALQRPRAAVRPAARRGRRSPATHNSMSVPLPGWFSAEQERPIAGQLRGRHPRPADRHPLRRPAAERPLRTYFGSTRGAAAARSSRTASATRRRRRAAAARPPRLPGEGERGMYLCHTFCELGATPLADVLRRHPRRSSSTNPGEVLVVVNQDYVTPADFVGASTTRALTQLRLHAARDGAWPTLREMIDSGRRLVLLAENHAGAAPWYQLAYERLIEETPFTLLRRRRS